jgi:hypothetical protein
MLNFGAPAVDFSPLARIGQTYDASRKAQAEWNMNQARQKTLAALGDNPDMSVLGTTLLRAGDVEGGMAALRLAEATKSGAASRGLAERQYEETVRQHRETLAATERERQALERQREYERERGDRPIYSPNAIPDEFGDPHPGFVDPRTGTVTPPRTVTPGPQSSIQGPVADAQASGLTVTSSYRGPNDPLTLANPSSAHAQGRAFDVRARSPAEADAAIGAVREQMAARGLQEGADYTIQDEVRNPSAHATGPHVHVALTPAGMSKYGGARAAAEPGMGGLPGAGLSIPGSLSDAVPEPLQGGAVVAQAAPAAPPVTATQINKGTENIAPMTNAEMIQEARRIGISPKQYRDARAAAIQKELMAKSGAADAEKALPGEVAGKLGIAETYLANAPKIREEIVKGGQTGVIDRLKGMAGVGRTGQVDRQIKSGVDALRRMLTGAGMPAAEANEYVRRYEPEVTDSVESLLTKHDQLVGEITHWRELAYRGKGTPEALPPPTPEYGAGSNSVTTKSGIKATW